jgi:hypothetical protein
LFVFRRFWDSVAAVLAEQHPDNPPIATGYAYDNYRDPPLNYTIKGNVMVGLVVGVFGDANATASDKAIWGGWHSAGTDPSWAVKPFSCSPVCCVWRVTTEIYMGHTEMALTPMARRQENVLAAESRSEGRGRAR